MKNRRIVKSIAFDKTSIGLILGPSVFVIVITFSIFLNLGSIESNQLDKQGLAQIFESVPPFVALGTMFWMVIWWITECVPMGYTGLLAPFIFIISGILTANQALQKFSDPIIWIFIAGFILAAAFKKSGLDERIAYKLAAFYKGSNPKIAIFFVACLPVFVLSMTGSITASTTIVFPIVLAFMNIHGIRTNNARNGIVNKSDSNSDNRSINTNEDEKNLKKRSANKSKYAEGGFLSLGQAATAGAMLLIISTAPNLIAKSTVEDFVPEQTITFTDWFLIGSPHAVIGLLISWTVIFLLIKPEFKSISSSTAEFKDKLKKMGRITKEEKIVLAILFLAIFLWILPSLLRSFATADPDAIDSSNIWLILLNGLANSIPISIPALLIILAIGFVKVRNGDKPNEHKGKQSVYEDKRTQGHTVLSWEEMLRAIDWNIIFLFGGGLVLGLGIEESGLASMIGSHISSIVGNYLTELSIFALSAVLGFILSYAASNTASAVIACPIAASLAIGAGFNPIPPIIAAALGASISSAIPSATPPMAIVYSSKAVSMLNMFKTGMVSDLLRLVLLILLGPLLVHLIY